MKQYDVMSAVMSTKKNKKLLNILNGCLKKKIMKRYEQKKIISFIHNLN